MFYRCLIALKKTSIDVSGLIRLFLGNNSFSHKVILSYPINSCHTRERCRFGRGCIYAHSQQELNEWKQEYDRKLKEKAKEDIKKREELFSSEMASNVKHVKAALAVSFESSLYGGFEQLVLFDFGRKPYLVKKLNADVTSESNTLPIAREHLASQAPAIWDERSVEVVRFNQATREALQAEHLLRKYSLPRQLEIADEFLSPKIYKSVMHQLLFVEERFMKEEISRYVQRRF